MIENVLHDIGGIGLYGVISVCLFFLVFSVALVRVCLLKKPFLNTMSSLPLRDGDEVCAGVSTVDAGEPGRVQAAEVPEPIIGPSSLQPVAQKGIVAHE